MDWDVISLPWATLVTLASGYAGYYVANVGLREHHKTIDITFSTLVFGFFATLAYVLILWVGSFHWVASIVSAVLAPIAAFSVALGLGVWWSKKGRRLLELKLRNGDVSHTNELPSAWLTMFSVTDVTARQLHVKLNDGTWLQCDDMRKFGEAPNGPCVFGASGDVLMYVTHRKEPKSEAEQKPEWKSVATAFDDEWGYQATYIPASHIARVDYRRRPTSWPPLP